MKVPAAFGLNRTVTVQFDEAARLVPQVFLKIVKSAAPVPVNAILLIVTAELPALVSVATFWPPALPTATFDQLSEEGEAETCAEAVRHPNRITEASSAAFVSMRLKTWPQVW
ncbi:MAG TPA: hypothetical protein VFW25_10360 [Silvibacterium sp.]|nr:hypothetical protein [Silvibacterium sp.]